MITAIVLTLSGCGTPVKVEYTIPGHWEGFIGLGNSAYLWAKGDLFIDITQSKECTVKGGFSGEYAEWGTFSLEFSGSPFIRDIGDIYGEISAIRTRAGVDTLTASVLFRGQFSETSAGAFGEWYTLDGSPFGASGIWTTIKK